jgi:uncharacterized protein
MKSGFKKESFFSVPKKELFEFHERDDAFSLLTPDSSNIDVQSVASTLAPSDDIVRFAVHFGPLKFKFENIHTVYEPHKLFVDEQKKGLFSRWKHEHRFIEAGPLQAPASMLSDKITYAHPLLPLFNVFVRHRLAGLFEYRHGETAKVLCKGCDSSEENTEVVIVTGATGLIGKRVVQILKEKGVRPIAFVRNVDKARKLLGDDVKCVHWDFHTPSEGSWKQYLGEADGVIHLAGTPLFSKRWSPSFKKEIEKSRVSGTRQLVDEIIAQKKRPRVFVTASALGYYGKDDNGVVDENTEPADDLLARICLNWEREARRLDEHGVRTVQMRIGIVLSTESGALKELLPLFKMGLGGTMGDARPYINWIHIEDVARMMTMALDYDQMKGPYNAAGPAPVTNGEFAKTIARVLGRPAFMHLPVSVVKLVIGEAGEYASGGPRAEVKKIQTAGYRFFFSVLEAALENLLG